MGRVHYKKVCVNITGRNGYHNMTWEQTSWELYYFLNTNSWFVVKITNSSKLCCLYSLSCILNVYYNELQKHISPLSERQTKETHSDRLNLIRQASKTAATQEEMLGISVYTLQTESNIKKRHIKFLD